MGRRDRVDRRQQLALEPLLLGRALEHEAGAVDRLLGVAANVSSPSAGSGASVSRAQRAAGVVEHLGDLAGRLRVGVVQPHVHAVQQEPGRPAAADHAGAEQADRCRQPVLSHGAAAPSRSRTSSGPSTRTFIASRIRTARSTSSPLVASTPRDR